MPRDIPLPLPGLQATLSAELDEAARAALDQGIKQYNNEASPAHLAARRPGGVRPLDIIVRDGDGRVRGGLSAATFWDWMEVKDLWLAPELRRRGLGALLLAHAEEEAAARACAHVHLKTFSFQARDFYLKQGYRIVGELAGYPPGHSFYWLRKELARAPQPGEKA